eukprot:11915827-Karenia_brevis.AAC.1
MRNGHKGSQNSQKGGPGPTAVAQSGVPGWINVLEGLDATKVQAANSLYRLCAKIFKILYDKGVACSIENPIRSYFWLTSWMRSLLDSIDEKRAKFVDFSMCMHGGARNKRTRLLTANIDLSSLALACDGSHEHLPWGFIKGSGDQGVFATAEERRYPLALCSRIARLVALHCDPESRCTLSNLAAPNFKQPRRGVALIADYKEIVSVWVEGRAGIPPDPGWQVKHSLPINSVFLHWKTAAAMAANGQEESGFKEAAVGIPWSVQEFVVRAAGCKHPFDQTVKVPSGVAELWAWMLRVGPTEVIKFRKTKCEELEKRVVDCKHVEQKLKDAMDGEVAKCVEEKRIVLFRELLQEIEYDDLGVVDYLTNGVKTVGNLAATGIWKPWNNRATCPVDAIWMNARRTQRELLKPRRHSDVDKVVWDATIKERDEGILKGPLSKDQVEEALGPLWVGARRFGIVQNGAVRPIDDFSEFLINSAFGAEEKISLNGLDDVIARARCWMEAIESAVGQVATFFDKDDEQWAGPVHPDWKDDAGLELVGRVADLKSAYKQMPLSPSCRCFSVVAVLCPEVDVPKLFLTSSLSFGQTAAVYAFLRISRALATIALKCFRVQCVEFFDDFTQLEPRATAESAQETMETMFRLLGWRISMKEDK